MPTPSAPQQPGINVTDEIYKTKNYFGWYIDVITYTGTGNCLYINIKKKVLRAVADSELQYFLLKLIKGWFFS